ncbi:TPA: MerR family transcriptional regulator [Streptococcus agalactiae]|uniref:MerR family transcriptional regulator n=1 Tax=Streptococcus agalactiae TaxID=1311 RepID=UPI0002B958CE|nr:MerR family transcriptional regulator [Streptococcus agalactiae]EPV42558.1 MerR family transcriptional regulator [Streptococcus agalactiae GB00893]KXA50325.1 transcriptional regulator, MerR family [Streptococcus agalactiae]HEN2324819.1 MerR family transcriptional regulator [Streptococcus agalactiae]HEN2448414.1 MerR family transcriptional regulator [Streptococcus agalactiae]HEN2466888.1 MerR family transcriptional regulator [Streptococcus agalactiae]
MLRNEIQNKTGLTRKAIEYYEEKGLINPQKTENGYRDYSDNDLEVLIKVSLFRKLGISVTEIEDYLSTGISSLSSVLRRKKHQLDVEEKRKEVLELVVKGESQELINEKIKLIEAEESIYVRLERLFPGYFGQMFFAAYQPFLNESLGKDEEEAFEKYVDYLDNLPSLQLSKEEQDYIEKISSTFDMQTLNKVNEDKINAIENVEEWLKENDNAISQYEQYKNSEEYQNSLMKKIQDKLQNFMKDNKYYEIAIPLIRKFSKSYDEYYEKLLRANEIYLDMKK